MLSIHSGIHQIWPQFSLDITTELCFYSGGLYFLDGANGSGKSSLLQGLLIPGFAALKDSLYRVYLPQFTAHQNFAIRAHAAMNKHHAILRTDLDCLNYLLNNLVETCNKSPRPVCLLVDESLYLEHVYKFMQDSAIAYLMIYTQHGHNPLLEHSRIISFKPLSQSLSKVYETSL